MKVAPWCLPALLACGHCLGASVSPAVFPKPRQMEVRALMVPLAASVPILLTERPSAEDLFLADFLAADLSDRFGLALQAKRVAGLPDRGPIREVRLKSSSGANPVTLEGLSIVKGRTPPGPQAFAAGAIELHL